MNPAIPLLIVGGILCLIGISMIIWPRRWAWFAQWGMYEQTPTPRAWYVASLRISGVILALGSLALIGLGSSMLSPAPVAQAPAVSPVEQAVVDAAALGERCQSVLPILDAAVITDEAGLIANADELEALAEQNQAGVRPPGGGVDDGTVLIVTIDGYAAFAIPNPPAGACGDFVLRVMNG